MTHRERLEARAERRRGWAENRAAAGEAARERVHRITDQIPFGQPILVGHHSEGHARADQRRIETGMRSAVDNWRMAEHHTAKAHGIEIALERTIFSDDADAVEQLEAKVAKLEAKRDNAKALNAAYRKEHRAELNTMSAYQRSQAVPFQSYEITGFGAEIRRCRERIETIKLDRERTEAGVRVGGRVMESRYAGTCSDCGQGIGRGDQITWFRSTREAVHVNCPASP